MARKDNGLTMELPGVPKRRGRPSTGKAMSNAERQKAFRQRRGARALDDLPTVRQMCELSLPVTINQSVVGEQSQAELLRQMYGNTPWWEKLASGGAE